MPLATMTIPKLPITKGGGGNEPEDLAGISHFSSNNLSALLEFRMFPEKTLKISEKNLHYQLRNTNYNPPNPSPILPPLTRSTRTIP
jgi:hypothetical protein